MFFTGPVHAGLVGGAAANLSPATPQSIGQAATEMVNGGLPESNIGLGSFDVGVPGWKVNVDGSIAYCQSAVASN